MTGTALRVAVVGGGRSCEHDVSLSSSAAVADALAGGGHEPVRLTIDVHGTWRDREDRPLGLAGAVHVLRTCDVVWPVLHGPGGEDGTLAALCDLVQVPYVGSGVAAGALAMDKWATKLVARDLGIPTAGATLLTRGTGATYRWTRPVVVKPVTAGSSHGVTLVERRCDLPSALAEAFVLDERVLAEEVQVGREIDVAVLGRPDGSRVVAPLLEIMGGGVFDLQTKYDGTARFRVPAPVSPAEQDALVHAALDMYDALGCRGVARVDFFLTARGPVLNEVNTMPGFTEASQVPRMFAAADTTYGELIDLLVRDTLA